MKYSLYGLNTMAFDLHLKVVMFDNLSVGLLFDFFAKKYCVAFKRESGYELWDWKTIPENWRITEKFDQGWFF
jgi:hypothetical protein